MIRKLRSSEDSGRGMVAESERRVIYARRENLPLRARVATPVQVELKKLRGPRRTG